ncbi:MAG: AAA family ATPase [Anaerovoracaceae bacterium]
MENKSLRILNEAKKVIVGKDEVLEKVLVAILSRGHILLDDVPGTGKTTLALTFSKALGMDYNRIQFTPDVVPSDIVGFSIYNKDKGDFEYKEGAVMTNLLLADEINRTSSKTQSALLEVMEERQTTVDGNTYKLPEPFVVIATQNPVGSAGTQLLPHAQLDRFMIKLAMGYPDFESQINILRDRQGQNPLENIQTVVSSREVVQMQDEADKVHIADEILAYVTTLAENTRKHPLVTLGVSPRGALAVCRMAKAYAYVSGRDYVKPEDITEVFTAVCNHRIILAPKARIVEATAESVIEEVMQGTASPDSFVEMK